LTIKCDATRPKKQLDPFRLAGYQIVDQLISQTELKPMAN
jgi:hypothetical protein